MNSTSTNKKWRPFLCDIFWSGVLCTSWKTIMTWPSRKVMNLSSRSSPTGSPLTALSRDLSRRCSFERSTPRPKFNMTTSDESKVHMEIDLRRVDQSGAYPHCFREKGKTFTRTSLFIAMNKYAKNVVSVSEPLVVQLTIAHL